MKVSELIKELMELNSDMEVILQKDPEGNGYELVRGAEEVWYHQPDDYIIGDEAEYKTALNEGSVDLEDCMRAVVIFP